MPNLIKQIAYEMNNIITLHKIGKATKKDLVNLAILTKCLENLSINNN